MTKEENLKFKEEIIKKKFKESLGYELNLENPKTFNEKLQWLKLYYHDPLMTKCTDKYLVREYVKEIIGEEYLIPLLGVWDNPDDIDFDLLPNQFVLKVNWGCGQNIIVKDKSKLNIEETKEKLKYWLEPFSNHYYYNFEWSYKNILPKIICEKYIEQSDGNLLDYKLHCFNGKALFIHIDFDRYGNHRRVIYNAKWEFTKFYFQDADIDKDKLNLEMPSNFDKLKLLAEKISNNFKYLRVDTYIVYNKIFIGELSVNHQNGMGKFGLDQWDYEFGELLELTNEKKLEYDYIDVDNAVSKLCDLEKIAVIYKKYEEDFKLYKSKYERLKSKSFSVFGFFDEEDYFTFIIFGIRITIKKKINKKEF